MIDTKRYARQIQLPSVGRAGQEKLQESCFALNPTWDASTAEMAATYARSAGFGAVETSSNGALSTELPEGLRQAFRYEGPRAVGIGAAFVLHAARVVLSEASYNTSKEHL